MNPSLSKAACQKFLKVLMVFPLIFSLHQLRADPFVEKCIGEECFYTEADLNVYGCSGSDVVLYAIDPTGNDPCLENATFQWYTYDYYNTGNGWDYGWITVNGATSNRYEVTNHATLEYYCEVNCNGNIYNTNTVEINYNSLPPSVVSHPEDLETCEGKEVFFEGLGSGTDIEYQWQTRINGGLWEDLSGETAEVLSIIPENEDDGRSFRLMISSSCALAVTATAHLTVHANPEPDLGEDIHICEGELYQIDLDDIFASYSWNTGEETSGISVSSAGVYSVSVTNENSCEGSDEIQIFTDTPIPTPDLGQDIFICQGESYEFSPSGTWDNYSWSNGTNASAVSITESGKIWLQVHNDNNVCTASDTVVLHVAVPYSQEKICMITTDPETGNNLVVWERTPGVGIESYNVYRQSNVLGEYEWIANLAASDLSVFEDTQADPETRQWVYKITAIDTCGNESDIALSPYHIPLFLQYVSSDNGINLTWVPYEVENGSMNFVSYIIYRGTDSTRLETVGEISADLKVYRDTDPKALENRYFYRVAGVRADACTPLPEDLKAGSGPFIHSLSNLEDNKVRNTFTDRNGVPEIHIYPNPASETLFLSIDQPDFYESVQILNMAGKIVYTGGPVTETKINVSLDGFAEGFYIIELEGKRKFRQGFLIK